MPKILLPIISLFLGFSCSTRMEDHPSVKSIRQVETTTSTRNSIFTRKNKKFSEIYRSINLSLDSENPPAKQYMLSHTNDLGITDEDLNQISGSDRHPRFEQYFGGYPIFATSYNVHVDGANSLISIDGILFDDIEVKNRDSLGFNDVEVIIAEEMKVDRNDLLFDCQKYIFPYQGELLYAAYCRVAYSPSGEIGNVVWAYWVNLDENTEGYPRILFLKNEARFSMNSLTNQIQPKFAVNTDQTVTLQGMVYTFNPLDGPLQIKDFLRLVPDENGSVSKLSGLHAEVRNDDPRFAAPKLVGGSFVNESYNESSQELDMLMVYYYLDHGKQFFQDLGFEDKDEQLIGYANVSKLGDEKIIDNAAYLGKFPLLNEGMRRVFIFSNGKDFKDPALSADVILHELSHYVVDYTTNMQQYIDDPELGTMINLEASGLHEGFADYFAGTITNDPLIGEYYCAKQNCPYEDGQDDDPGNNPLKDHLRNLAETNRIYSTSLSEAMREVHIMGEMWGQAMWSLRSLIITSFATINVEQTETYAREVDKLLLGALNYLSQSTESMLEGYQAVLLADEELNRGKYHVPIIRIFNEKGFQVPSGIPSDNATPIAVAGPQNELSIEIASAGNVALIDGSNSYDLVEGNQQPVMAFYWNLTARPEGSTYLIPDPFQKSFQFSPDAPGTYVLDLFTSDEYTLSAPSRVVVNVTLNGQMPNSEALPPSPDIPAPLPNATFSNYYDSQATGPYSATVPNAFTYSDEVSGNDVMVTSAGGCLLEGGSGMKRNPASISIRLLLIGLGFFIGLSRRRKG